MGATAGDKDVNHPAKRILHGPDPGQGPKPVPIIRVNHQGDEATLVELGLFGQETGRHVGHLTSRLMCYNRKRITQFFANSTPGKFLCEKIYARLCGSDQAAALSGPDSICDFISSGSRPRIGPISRATRFRARS